MSEVKLDWDVIVQLLAAGNPFIWGLVAIALLCLAVLAWIKYEEQMRRHACFSFARKNTARNWTSNPREWKFANYATKNWLNGYTV